MVTSHREGGYDIGDNIIGVFLCIAAFIQIFYLVSKYKYHPEIASALVQQ